MKGATHGRPSTPPRPSDTDPLAAPMTHARSGAIEGTIGRLGVCRSDSLAVLHLDPVPSVHSARRRDTRPVRVSMHTCMLSSSEGVSAVLRTGCARAAVWHTGRARSPCSRSGMHAVVKRAERGCCSDCVARAVSTGSVEGLADTHLRVGCVPTTLFRLGERDETCTGQRGYVVKISVQR